MIRRFWLKGCPRCQGDMVLEIDRFGVYRACLQCGHTQEPHDLVKPNTQPVWIAPPDAA